MRSMRQEVLVDVQQNYKAEETVVEDKRNESEKENLREGWIGII